jgi:alpha-mannosidase
VELSVLPHRGSWRDAGVVAAAAVRNSPPAVRRGSDESAPVPALWRPLLDAPAGIRVTELRPRGTGGIMLRLAEAHGVGGTARLALPEGARAGLAGIDEQLLGPVDLVDGVAVIRLPPFAVRTLLIDRSPIPARPDDGGR